MWTKKEIAEIKYITKALNEILPITHGVNVIFKEETHNAYIVTAGATDTDNAHLVINVTDDNARGYFEDVVMSLVNDL